MFSLTHMFYAMNRRQKYTETGTGAVWEQQLPPMSHPFHLIVIQYWINEEESIQNFTQDVHRLNTSI